MIPISISSHPSAASDKMHYLDLRPMRNQQRFPISFVHNLAIQFYRHPICWQPHMGQKCGNR